MSFPPAVVPLWQLRHEPITALWSTETLLLKFVDEWQSWQRSLLLMWLTGFDMAWMPAPEVWQPSQVLGVFLKRPCAWHVSHVSPAWAPVMAKPVVLWSNVPVSACAPAGSSARTKASAHVMKAKRFIRLSLIYYP